MVMKIWAVLRDAAGGRGELLAPVCGKEGEREALGGRE
jgi:hypothetical protein